MLLVVFRHHNFITFLPFFSVISIKYITTNTWKKKKNNPEKNFITFLNSWVLFIWAYQIKGTGRQG